MHALRMREVEVDRKVFGNLLLERNVRGIDSRICIVLTKDPHARAERNATARSGGNNVRPGRWLRRSSEAGEREGRGAGDTKLLGAVVGDRTNLRQHILSPVIDSIARSQKRVALLGDIPSEANTRLKLFLGTV